MSNAREEHGHQEFVGSPYDLTIAHGSSRLNDGRHADFSHQIY
jgi:hypothetical protein